MTFDDFRASLDRDTPPAGVAPTVVALWHDGQGNWDEAHRVAQDIDSAEGAWIHAYLHRREGDLGNAAYWYRQAGRPVQSGDLAEEWETIVRALLP